MGKVFFIFLCSLVAPSLQFFWIFDNSKPTAPANKVCEWFGTAPVCSYSQCPHDWTLVAQMDKPDGRGTRYGYYGSDGCVYGFKRLCCDNKVVKKAPTEHCRDHIHYFGLDGDEIQCPTGLMIVAAETTTRNKTTSKRSTVHVICCDDGTLVMSEEERIQSMKIV